MIFIVKSFYFWHIAITQKIVCLPLKSDKNKKEKQIKEKGISEMCMCVCICVWFESKLRKSDADDVECWEYKYK